MAKAKTQSKNTKKENDSEQQSKKTKKHRIHEYISEETLDWLKQNWKITLVIFFCTFLVFFMKIHEESGYRSTQKHQDNLYEVLGLESSSSLKDIKKQYNKLAMELHPDKHPNCTSCGEQFSKISHAYEVLSDEEKKQHYDETEGILETIKSEAKPIYEHNYHQSVLESPHIWIIQVYTETSSTCQTFSGFWEEYVKEFDYLKFGRIHLISQKNLIPKLPFAVDEVPFVFSMSQQLSSEVFEYSYDESPNSKFTLWIRNVIGVHYYDSDLNQYQKLSETRPTKKTVVLIHQDSIPIIFRYFAFRHSEYITFYATIQNQYRSIIEKTNSKKTSVVVFNEKEFEKIPSKREFEVGYSKTALKNILAYSKLTVIPRKLIRNLSIFIFGILHRRVNLRKQTKVK